VSEAEYMDLIATRTLQPGPNSFAFGKWFAESAEHAGQWGNVMEGVGKYRIVEFQFPKAAADQFMRHPMLDSIGAARFGTFEQLGRPAFKLLSPP
jgi:hypothetical protein